MAENRFLHPRLGHSFKVSALSDFEFRVWVQYLLSADDYGVMPMSPALLRGANQALAGRPDDAILGALDTIVAAQLVTKFTHQHYGYLATALWQDFQKIAHPRHTYYPLPPADVLATFSVKTRQLFKKHSGNILKSSKHLRVVGSRKDTLTLTLPQTLALNGKEGEREREAPELPSVAFQIPESITLALDKCRHFTQVPKLRTAAYWQAQVRAFKGVDFAADMLSAQSWIEANPAKAPKSDYAAFLHRWFRRTYESAK